MHNTLDQNVTQLSQGSIGKALFELSVPIVLSNTLYTSHQLVNAFWVGRLGAGAVAAVSVNFPVLFLLVSLGGGLAVAGSILVAQYAGARNYTAVNHVSAQTLLMVVATSAVLSVIGYVFVTPILRWMGTGADIFEDSAHYMRVSFMGIVFMFTFAMFQSILRGIGEVKIPLYVIALSVILNLILDPLFIFGWGPVRPGGVVGAAYATLMTEGLASLVGFWILFGSRYEVRLRLRDFAPDMALVKRVFLLGLPASVEQSMQALGMTVFTAFVSHFGTTANAAYGVGFRVLTFVIIPAFGISMATATLVGQSIGAGDFKRAKKTAVVSAWYAFWLLTATAVVVFAGATHLVRFFVPEDPAVIREGALVVRLMAGSFGLLGAQLSLMGAIRGAGDTVMPMVLTIVSMWVIRIPLAYYLSHYTSLGAIGLWYSFPAPAIVTTILAIVQFKRQHWKPLVKRNELQGNLMEEILVDEGRP